MTEEMFLLGLFVFSCVTALVAWMVRNSDFGMWLVVTIFMMVALPIAFSFAIVLLFPNTYQEIVPPTGGQIQVDPPVLLFRLTLYFVIVGALVAWVQSWPVWK